MSAAIETALFANVLFLWKCIIGEKTSKCASVKFFFSFPFLNAFLKERSFIISPVTRYYPLANSKDAQMQCQL